MAQRLVRNSRNAVLGGVAAGFGDYLEVDPVLIRLIFVLLCIAGGSGVLLYLVCWLVMPRDDQAEPTVGVPAEHFAEEVREAGERVAANLRRTTSQPGRGRLLAGLALIAFGFLFLLDRFTNIWWLDFWRLWPLLLIAAGVAILVRSGAPRSPEARASEAQPAWTPPPPPPPAARPPSPSPASGEATPAGQAPADGDSWRREPGDDPDTTT